MCTDGHDKLDVMRGGHLWKFDLESTSPITVSGEAYPFPGRPPAFDWMVGA